MKAYLKICLKFGSILSFLFAFTLAARAQVRHNVAVTDNSFSPASLTIQPGDEVVWTNTGGEHNVNGTQSAYPNNPVSFGNNLGFNWTYSFTFDQPGIYDYRCDLHVSMGMTGRVTVGQATSVDPANESTRIVVYPNPANNMVILSGKLPTGSFSIRVIDLTGKVVKSIKEPGDSGEIQVDVSDLNAGAYYLSVESGGTSEWLKLVKSE